MRRLPRTLALTGFLIILVSELVVEGGSDDDFTAQAADVCVWGTGVSCNCVDRSLNLALGASVDSPDGHEQDWCTGARENCNDSWAVDGRLDTYWDEADDQELYRLRVHLPANHTRVIAGIAIVGFSHFRFAPRTFLVTCDEVSIVEETNAPYVDNKWEACFAPRECSQIEIVISEAYGASPGIRELQLFGPATQAQMQAAAAAAASADAKGSGIQEHRLLLPPNIGTSACGHLAGQTLMCIGRNGGADECGALRFKHWECVRDESLQGRQGLGGHRALNRLVEYRYGHLLYNPFDVYFAVAIELYGEWSEHEMHVMRRFIHAGDTVVEAGVHIGSLTVAFGQLVGPSGRVVGLEPQRVLYQMAAANVAINGLWNVELHNTGAGNLSDSHAAVPIVQYEANAFRNFGGIKVGEVAEEVEAAVEWVRIRKIDELELRACDFLKADTEGYEDKVLAGARHTVAAYKPVIYFEDNDEKHSDVRHCPQAARVLAREHDYRCLKHVTPYFNPDNFRREPTDYFWAGQGPSMSYMVLCVHPEREGAWDAAELLLVAMPSHLHRLSCS